MIRRPSYLAASAVHPGRGEPSRIELRVTPEGRKSGRPDFYVLTEEAALRLATELLGAYRNVRGER